MLNYAYYDYINFGHYPGQFAALTLNEKAMVMAFIDQDVKNRKKDAKLPKGGKR